MTWLRNGVVVLLLASVSAVPVSAQAPGTAALTGTVADPTGAVVPGADLKLTNPATGLTRTTTSGPDGIYLLPRLDPATYRLEVTAQGFKTGIYDRVVVAVGITTTLNIQLEVGAVTETVEVQAAAVVLNTSDASLGVPISGTEVLNLPALDRNPAGLLSLQAGVTFVPGSGAPGGYGGQSLSEHRSGSVSGSRSDQTNITLDGVDVNDPITGIAFFSALRVPLDSLQEFRVTTTNYSAEGGGRSSAAQVSLVTKSGSNELHGSAYYLHRNEAFNANDFFLNRDGVEEGKFRRHLYGASLGLPVVKNRFFLFGNWERNEESLFESAERSVPALHMRDGVFIYTCANDPAGVHPDCPSAPTTVQGISGTTYNVPAGSYGLIPAEITAIDGLGIGPNAASLAQWANYPAPNSPGSQDRLNLLGFNFAAPIDNTFNTYLLRGDFHIDSAAKHTLFWRGTYQDDTQSTAPAFPGQDPFTRIRVANKGFAMGYAAVLSPTMVNNFRWGITRIKDETAGLRSREFVWHRFLFDPFGFATAGGGHNSTRGRTVPQHHLRNDFTWTRGRHTFTFGGEARYTRNARFSDALSFNVFTINPSWLPDNGNEVVPGHPNCIAAGCTQVPISTFGRFRDLMTPMLAPISAVTARYNFDRTGATLPTGSAIRRRYAVDEYEFYAQDQWRLTPTLTLNLGLRYFAASPPWEQNGNQVAPNPGMSEWFACRQQAMLAGLPSLDTCGLVEMALGGKANNAPGFYSWDKNNFSPRIGIAWAPGNLGWFSGDRKMTIRVGYSLVYDRIGNALAVSFDERGAFGMSTSISDSLGSCSIATERGRPPCARFTGHGDTAAAAATLNSATPSSRPPPAAASPPPLRSRSSLSRALLTIHSAPPIPTPPPCPSPASCPATSSSRPPGSAAAVSSYPSCATSPWAPTSRPLAPPPSRRPGNSSRWLRWARTSSPWGPLRSGRACSRALAPAASTAVASPGTSSASHGGQMASPAHRTTCPGAATPPLRWPTTT